MMRPYLLLCLILTACIGNTKPHNPVDGRLPPVDVAPVTTVTPSAKEPEPQRDMRQYF